MHFDLSKLLEGDLRIPESGIFDGITAVRVKTLRLMDKSGSAIRMTLTARESDPHSSVSSFLRQSFFYHSALKSFDVISADIAIHYSPQAEGQLGEVKVLSLTGYGTSNLHNISEKERSKFESYLKEWGILIDGDDQSAQDDHGRGALYLLSKRVEAASGYMRPYLVNRKDKSNFSLLRNSDLLSPPKKAVATVSICPNCLRETFDPRKRNCSACGKVEVEPSDVVLLEPNLDALFRKIRQSLGIEQTTPRSIGGSKKIWLLGEVGRGARKSKVIFASNLGATFVELLAGWSTHVGAMQAIVLTTSNPDTTWPSIPGLLQQPKFFSFRDHFRLVDKKLVADSVLKDATKPAAPGGVSPVFGPFSHDFRHVYLPGESVPIKLSTNRAEVFKILWAAHGEKVHIDHILDTFYGKGSGKNMDDVFQRNNQLGKEAHRALKHFVGHETNYYWLKAEAFHEQ